MRPPTDPGPRRSFSILLYHEVSPEGQRRHPYDVGEGAFARQLERLTQAGFRTMSFEEAREPGRGCGARTVIITFDDAQVNNYTVALPLLERFGFTATFFIPTAFIGKDAGQLGMSQLVEMHGRGMGIQSHSHTHPFLNGIPYRALVEELTRSKAILEQNLGATVDVLACPGGRYNRAVLQAAAATGYRGVCTSRPGRGARAGESGIRVYDRILIDGRTRDGELLALAHGRQGPLWRRRLEYGLRAALKGAVGDGLYHRIWHRLRT